MSLGAVRVGVACGDGDRLRFWAEVSCDHTCVRCSPYRALTRALRVNLWHAMCAILAPVRSGRPACESQIGGATSEMISLAG